MCCTFLQQNKCKFGETTGGQYSGVAGSIPASWFDPVFRFLSVPSLLYSPCVPGNGEQNTVHVLKATRSFVMR